MTMHPGNTTERTFRAGNGIDMRSWIALERSGYTVFFAWRDEPVACHLSTGHVTREAAFAARGRLTALYKGQPLEAAS